MKRFRFSLEKVLGYRRQLEQDRRRAFTKAVEVFRRREGELKSLSDDLARYRTRLAEIGTGRLSARELGLYRSYLTYLETQVARALEWFSDASAALESRRGELAAASREKKVLEKVRQRQRLDHDYDAGREETGQLDEVAATRFIRARGGSPEEGTV